MNDAVFGGLYTLKTAWKYSTASVNHAKSYVLPPRAVTVARQCLQMFATGLQGPFQIMIPSRKPLDSCYRITSICKLLAPSYLLLASTNEAGCGSIVRTTVSADFLGFWASMNFPPAIQSLSPLSDAFYNLESLQKQPEGWLTT